MMCFVRRIGGGNSRESAMYHISFRVIRHWAGCSLIGCFVYCGDLQGQTSAARGSLGNQSTGAANSGGNAIAGRGSAGGIGGSSAGNAAGSTTRNSAGNSTGNSTGSSSGYQTGNRGLNYVGGAGYGARWQWGNGSGYAGGGYGADSGYGSTGGYGGAGAYNTAAYGSADAGTTLQDVGASFPGSVTRLPHWREVGTTPLPATFKANVDNAGTNPPAVSTPVSGPSVLLRRSHFLPMAVQPPAAQTQEVARTAR